MSLSSSSSLSSIPIQTKLVLLGEAAVGKTSIVLRFTKEDYSFTGRAEPTIGASFLTKQVEDHDGKVIKFEIWDTAGQERFHSLAPMYYRGAPAAIVVYDITSMASFDRAQRWVQELHIEGSSDMIIAFVGNKLDLDSERKVASDVAKKYCQQKGLLFIETSAKSGEHVSELFSLIAKKIPHQQPTISSKSTVKVQMDQKPSNGSGSGITCC